MDGMHEDQQADGPEVLFVYARQGERIHLEQHGLAQGELGMLVTAWWLQLSVVERGVFIEQLSRYQLGTDEPPPVAVGIAAIVRRGGTSPGSSNGQVHPGPE